MASYLKNKLAAEIGTTPVTIHTATAGLAKTTCIGLSLTNLTGSIILVSVNLIDTLTSTTISVSNVQHSTQITGVSDADAAMIGIGYTVVGDHVPQDTRVIAKEQVSTDNNTLTLSNYSQGGAITSATFYNAVWFMKEVILPPNQSLRAINGGEKLVLSASTAINISSNADNSVDGILSFVEIV
jgi:hypothetical protein